MAYLWLHHNQHRRNNGNQCDPNKCIFSTCAHNPPKYQVYTFATTSLSEAVRSTVVMRTIQNPAAARAASPLCSSLLALFISFLSSRCRLEVRHEKRASKNLPSYPIEGRENCALLKIQREAHSWCGSALVSLCRSFSRFRWRPPCSRCKVF